MEVKNLKKIIASSMIVITSVFIGCGKGSEEVLESKKIELSKGAIIVSEGNTLKNYDYKAGKYTAVNEEIVVSNYNEKSGNYIYIKEGKHYASNGINNVLVDGYNSYSLTLSPSGGYMSYFDVEDEEYKLVIKDIKKDENVEIKNKVTISGRFVQWVGEGVLAYYGISTDGVNGIFTYDIKTEEEKLIHKIDSGFIEQLVSIDNVLYFVENDFSSKKLVKALHLDGEFSEILKVEDGIVGKLVVRESEAFFTLKSNEGISLKCATKDGKITRIADNVEEINDIVRVKDKFIFLGKVKGDNQSLYLVENGKAKRIAYDFPKRVFVEKGFLKVEEDGVLFIGNPDGEDIGNTIYKVDSTGAISLVYSGKGESDFIRFN